MLYAHIKVQPNRAKCRRTGDCEQQTQILRRTDAQQRTQHLKELALEFERLAEACWTSIQTTARRKWAAVA